VLHHPQSSSSFFPFHCRAGGVLAEAAVWHNHCPQTGLNTACRGRAREITMRKIHLFAIAAAVIATGVGVLAASTTDAPVPISIQGIEPLQLMMNAKGLPTAEAYDHG